MAYLSHVRLTRDEFAGLIAQGTVLDRPVWFSILDARPGEPTSYLGFTGQAPAVASLLNQPPRLSSAQRDAMRNVERGTLIYNLTTDVFEFFSLAGWTHL